MDDFAYRDGRLHCEDVPLDALAGEVGTPAFVYSRRTLERHLDTLAELFRELAPLLCFSVKTCGNVHLLRLLAERGSGMDVVSGGELHRALTAGTPPERIVFAGVGKTDRDLAEALRAGVGWINVESEQELAVVSALARSSGARPRLALRVNPDVSDGRTHAWLATGRSGTKFGVDIERARELFSRQRAAGGPPLTGIHVHLGSPIHAAATYGAAVERVLGLLADLTADGHRVEMLDMGGGLPADYGDEELRSWSDFADVLVPPLRSFVQAGGSVVLEPGRAIAANAGVLLTRVSYVKEGGGRRFAVVDAGMNTLIRPALYGAEHFMWPVVADGFVPRGRRVERVDERLERMDVVGPICEGTDCLARDRSLPPLQRGDLLCIFATGAYGMVMASQYNAQPRPPEVLVSAADATLVRRRERYADLVELELAAEQVPLALASQDVARGARIPVSALR